MRIGKYLESAVLLVEPDYSLFGIIEALLDHNLLLHRLLQVPEGLFSLHWNEHSSSVL